MNWSYIINSTSATDQIDDSTQWKFAGYKVVGSLTAIIAVLAFITNLIVIIIFIKIRTLLNPTNVFILSLSIGNLAISLIGSPFSITSNLSERWLWGMGGCKWYGFANTFFGLVAISNHTAIAIHRYLVICTDGRGATFTSRTAVVWSLVGWLYGFCWAIFPVIGWANYGFEGPGTWCSVVWFSKDPVAMSYVLCLFLFCFFIPVAIIGTMYCLIFRQVRNITKHISHDAMLQRSLQRQRRLIKLTISIYCAFLLAWTPYSIVSLIRIVGYGDILDFWTQAMPALFAKTSTVYNPIIYVGMSANFRTALKKVLEGVESTILDKDVTIEKVPLKVKVETPSHCQKEGSQESGSQSHNVEEPCTLVGQSPSL